MSNLTFEEHDPPILIYSSEFNKDYQVVTVRWKGLDFLRIAYTEETERAKALTRRTNAFNDEDDDEDDEGVATVHVPLVTEPTPQPREYVVQCLMPSFAYYWGKADTIEAAKALAYKAEAELVKFAYMIQTRRA